MRRCSRRSSELARAAQHVGRARLRGGLAARLAGDAHGVDVEARVDLDAQLVEQVLGQQRVVGQQLVEARGQVLLEGRHAALHDQAPVGRAVQAGLDLEIERAGIDDQDLDERVRRLEIAVDAAALDGVHVGAWARARGSGFLRQRAAADLMRAGFPPPTAARAVRWPILRGCPRPRVPGPALPVSSAT
jgi:hypothetical protein